MKGIGEKEISQLNAEFQRLARTHKKAFLSEQHQETEENNRMGKTRDLIKKTGDIKETLHIRIGALKDRNGKDLTEAEEIKKMWQEYTEELYKKAREGDGMPAEIFQILKDAAAKVLYSICQQIWKTQQ